MRVLPESTERLLHSIDSLPAADGLLLVGGTALALRIGHRSSVDLDFAFAAPRLPRIRIAGLLSELRGDHQVQMMPNVAAEQDFLNSGRDLADYQQDFSIDHVKVTFFAPDPASLVAALKPGPAVAGLKRIHVADIDSLFTMKAVTLNQRITTRDLFDVYTLIHAHHYPAADVFKLAERFHFSSDTLKTRLLHATKRLDDPGVETPTGTAPDFEQLQAYFAELIDRLEQDESTAAFREELNPAGSGLVWQPARTARQSRRKRSPSEKK